MSTRRPDTYPRVPDDFGGPVLLELYGHQRWSGYRFALRGTGTTDNAPDAGLFTMNEAREMIGDGSVMYAVSAEAVLVDEHARLSEFQARIEAVKNGKETA